MDRQFGPTKLLEAASTGHVAEVLQLLTDPSVHIDVSDILNKTALWFAVESGNPTAAKTLLEAGANINKTHRSKQTVLMLAVMKNNLELVKLLTDSGADLDLTDSFGMTATMIATQKNHLECLRHLLSCGGQLNMKDIRGKSALMIAVEEGHHDCLELLIEAKAELAFTDFNNHTPMVTAILKDHHSCLQTLIKAGVDPNMVDRHNQTAIIAAVDGHCECLQTLIKAGANVNRTDRKNRSALMLAAGYGNVDCVACLIQAGADVNFQGDCERSALMWATINNHVSCVEHLLNHGAARCLQDDDGKTAAMMAAEKNHPDCLSPLIAGLGEEELNTCCSLGQTAVMYAVKGCHVKCLQCLIQSGASVNKASKSKETALILAVKNACNYFSQHRKLNFAFGSSDVTECVQYLIDAGARLDSYSLGKTPLMYASMFQHCIPILELLVKGGANVELCDFNGKTPLALAVSESLVENVRFLLNAGSSVNKTDLIGKTPLIYAIEHGWNNNSSECIQCLLDYGADVHVQDKQGKTTLMYCVKNSSDTVILKLLVERGVGVNVVDTEGASALTYAIGSDSLALDHAEVLISAGADPKVGTFKGKTVVPLALYHRNVQLLELLISQGAELNMEWDEFRFLIVSDEKEILQLMISNGIMPPMAESCMPFSGGSSAIGASFSACRLEYAKYLICVGYLYRFDLFGKYYIHTTTGSMFYQEDRDKLLRDRASLLVEIYSQPWPLVKLCFVSVSTLLGTGPKRLERIKESQLPGRLQRLLLFQEPITKLCIHQWQSISLCFDPMVYETLPCPRPLLYYWPYGRKLVENDCDICTNTCYRFL
ncbi:ankyrin repeat domain-containing protein 50-like [Physella acuta]|uniref:ankyrin repeat domain-containing protein 50-like n=1 Tax=Physella acuta TaxID=109671 RepID=UPI0027DE8AB2|nr:ankyrin repeat domain-containing protein 50-like [Physella acuta]